MTKLFHIKAVAYEYDSSINKFFRWIKWLIKMNSKKSKNKNLNLIKHPLLQELITVLRDKKTKPADFRKVTSLLATFMGYEVAKKFKTKKVNIETPFEKIASPVIAPNILVIAIMRAGNAMLDPILNIFPNAKAGHVGMYRDKYNNNTAVEYYFKVPENIKGYHVLVVDPLFATGNTIVATINQLKKYKVGKIDFLTFLSSTEGIKKLTKAHPDVTINTLSIERELDKNGYLIPGVGDAGDRLYGTK
ncbi:MAG: uracil phosphoribosyltransferase [Oligoflexia bacterium]|nr:uracil phosphoribosyltransferase [Oligoflexia bacterium]